MARQDMTTMTILMDVYDEDDNTASCEAAAHQEAETGPSIRNNQTMRGENGQKLATTMPGTVTMPPLATTTMVTADNDGFGDGDGATGVGDNSNGSGATGRSG